MSRTWLALIASMVIPHIVACGAPTSTQPVDEVSMSSKKDSEMHDPEMASPPMDTSLVLEREVGIKDCFLAPARMNEMERMGWEFVRCDHKYAVASSADRIGLSESDQVSRQAAVLTIFQQGRVPDAIDKMRWSARNAISGPTKSSILRRYNVSRERAEVFVSGFIDASEKELGTVSIGINDGNVCEFIASSMPYPQTYCRALVGDVLIELRTNSTDFEAMQQSLSLILQLGWRN